MTATGSRVLVVDDEAHIVELARLYLAREGYDVEGVGDGAQALARFGQLKPDLVILDVMLPGSDGLTICREIRRQSQVPIIMLTARDEVTDKVVGLELGADDYLTKPFNPRELVARAKAVLRRSRSAPKPDAKPIRAGALTIDPARHEARFDQDVLKLRAQEFDLLTTLAAQPGRVFTREQLLRDAWGFDYYGQTRTVDVHVAHLRKKLEGTSVRIETVTGVGYRLAC